ncbi:methionine ABC transporter ATP-binding protein [Shouchella patagoniensis]|uniref:methionine ABC transporter ATP-binding protein n=1 Tax=Shouchella patagoniensis TaxID=228576 RepID=UPI000995A6AF|nr:ATP-binding cassette domain-containing protein [Shouchella patagoniensis]
MIEFKQVSKTYQTNGKTVKALDQINLKIDQGDIYGVIGFSGAGKSTLLRTVNLLERPTSGEIIVNNKNVAELKPNDLQKTKRNIGMIFQHFNLLQSKTVFENIAIPLKLVKTPKNEIKKRVQELLSFVGLTDKATNYPDQLSGGQKQRIGIARALATNPDILLCDEATSALDPETTSSILQLLKKINRDYNITILIITHEMSVIRELCDKVAVMEAGRVIEAGSVFSLFSNPTQETTKKFVRSIISDHLPEKVKTEIEKKEDNQQIYQLKVTDEALDSTLFSSLIQNAGVEVNILYASMQEVQGKSFGVLYLQIKGEHEQRLAARAYLNNQPFQIKEVTNNVRLVA